jgi:hypothetical protein
MAWKEGKGQILSDIPAVTGQLIRIVGLIVDGVLVVLRILSRDGEDRRY